MSIIQPSAIWQSLGKHCCVFINLDAKIEHCCVFINLDAEIEHCCVFINLDAEIEHCYVFINLDAEIEHCYVFINLDTEIVESRSKDVLQIRLISCNRPKDKLYNFPCSFMQTYQWSSTEPVVMVSKFFNPKQSLAIIKSTSMCIGKNSCPLTTYKEDSRVFKT
jgi:hypothetical protein